MRRRAGGRQRIPRPADWLDAGQPAWGALPPGERRFSLDQLEDHLRRRGPGRPPHPAPLGARHSAVLIALFEGDDDVGPEVVLTRRSEVLSSHRGEVAFPGGRTDPGETPVQTATREAVEEVDLDPDLITVIGDLDHLYTVVSRSHIVPVVARLAERPVLRPVTVEVDRILTVPLAELMSDDVYHREAWGTAPFERAVHFFDLDDETIWGATGLMLVQLLEVGLGLDEAAGAA